MRALLVLLCACGRVGFDGVGDGGSADPLTITRLQIYDPVTDLPLLDITNGGTFDIRQHTTGITVIAEVAGAAGCVDLVRNGVSNVEIEAPYASGADDGTDDFGPDTTIVVGMNTLAVTAYELADKGGRRGPTKSVALELALPVDMTPSIAHVGFITNTGTGFLEIVDGTTYRVGDLPSPAEILVNATPTFVGSVVFSGTGPWSGNTENYAPYTAMGSESSFTPTVGMTYTLAAQAYELGNGKGATGGAYMVQFSIGP